MNSLRDPRAAGGYRIVEGFTVDQLYARSHNNKNKPVLNYRNRQGQVRATPSLPHPREEHTRDATRCGALKVSREMYTNRGECKAMAIQSTITSQGES